MPIIFLVFEENLILRRNFLKNWIRPVFQLPFSSASSRLFKTYFFVKFGQFYTSVLRQITLTEKFFSKSQVCLSSKLRKGISYNNKKNSVSRFTWNWQSYRSWKVYKFYLGRSRILHMIIIINYTYYTKSSQGDFYETIYFSSVIGSGPHLVATSGPR